MHELCLYVLLALIDDHTMLATLPHDCDIKHSCIMRTMIGGIVCATEVIHNINLI